MRIQHAINIVFGICGIVVGSYAQQPPPKDPSQSYAIYSDEIRKNPPPREDWGYWEGKNGEDWHHDPNCNLNSGQRCEQFRFRAQYHGYDLNTLYNK